MTSYLQSLGSFLCCALLPPSLARGLLCQARVCAGGPRTCALVLTPIPAAAKPMLFWGDRTHRDSKAACLGRILFLSGCVNLGICLIFLIWKKWIK